MYIYKITNLVNQKVYIGQTVQKNPKMRWYDHQASARKGKKSPLYNSIRKHGVDKFAWEIIDSTLSVDDLNKKEAVWLDHYRNLTEVYNIREAGNNKLHSDKSILKMQESQRQAHARRRAEGRDGGWKRIDGGAMKGKSHPRKGTSGMWLYTEEQKKEQSKRMSEINKRTSGGKTWKIINGKRTWLPKEASV
jgi:group I intron endonuclease